MYTAAGQGQTAPGNKILMSTEISCHFGHLLQVLNNFIQFVFMILYMYVAPGQEADNPLGTKFLCQQEHLVTLVICCKFYKKNLFEV